MAIKYSDRYRLYEEEKKRLPKGLTYAEYETAVKNIAKKYKI